MANEKGKQPFKVKNKSLDSSRVICRGKCSCGEGKTEPARNLSSNISHLFAWEILMPLPKRQRNTWELRSAFYCSSETIIEWAGEFELSALFSKQHDMSNVFNDLDDFLLYFYWFCSNSCSLLCKWFFTSLICKALMMK